ncbi:MAG: tetratricopeptide repeat protein [Chitinophagaceae bacterium]
MKRATQTTYILIFLSVLLIGCTEKKSTSPYDSILKNPPFSGITDSIKNDTKNDKLYFRRAVLLNSNNFPEPALADFEKAWSLAKNEEYALGISTLLLEKTPDSAILFLRDALNKIPNSFLLQLSLSRGLLAENKIDDALVICNEILQKMPTQVDVMKMKADILEKKGNLNESINILEEAYWLTPFDVELNYILALKYAETKNPKVISLCESLIRADSLEIHPEPYYYKGIYFSMINDKARAISFFDDAVKHDYNFLEGYIEKGGVLFEMKKYREALKVFKLAQTISPKFADAYYWIAKCQEAMGQNEEAKINYERAYQLDKNFTEAKEAAEKITK